MSYGQIFPDSVWCCHQDNVIGMDMLLSRNKTLANSNNHKNKYMGNILLCCLKKILLDILVQRLRSYITMIINHGYGKFIVCQAPCQTISTCIVSFNP